VPVPNSVRVSDAALTGKWLLTWVAYDAKGDGSRKVRWNLPDFLTIEDGKLVSLMGNSWAEDCPPAPVTVQPASGGVSFSAAVANSKGVTWEWTGSCAHDGSLAVTFRLKQPGEPQPIVFEMQDAVPQ
jgi:hypothetical protein